MAIRRRLVVVIAVTITITAAAPHRHFESAQTAECTLSADTDTAATTAAATESVPSNRFKIRDVAQCAAVGRGSVLRTEERRRHIPRARVHVDPQCQSSKPSAEWVGSAEALTLCALHKTAIVVAANEAVTAPPTDHPTATIMGMTTLILLQSDPQHFSVHLDGRSSLHFLDRQHAANRLHSPNIGNLDAVDPQSTSNVDKATAFSLFEGAPSQRTHSALRTASALRMRPDPFTAIAPPHFLLLRDAHNAITEAVHSDIAFIAKHDRVPL